MLLLPQLEMATTKQVAEFYGVSTALIKMTISNNRDEFDADGHTLCNGKELAGKINLPAKNKRGYIEWAIWSN
ncbi:hypothetical protein [Lentibacillus jeotgali]|uniref:hypothetical protein n=1 Tax=Lentibacillus jeotgali TaxID=558169 RepID=UPI0002625C75|nr:hypothetical protein [Lentibacillus jeotgali]